MTCNNCSAKLADGALVCHKCGERVTLPALSKGIKELKEKRITTVKNSFHSPIFIGIAICVSVIAALTLSSAIESSVDFFFGLIAYAASGNGIGVAFAELISLPLALFWIIFAVSATRSTVSAWKLIAKRGNIDSLDILSLKKFPDFMQKMVKKVMIAGICVFAFLIVFSIYLMYQSGSGKFGGETFSTVFNEIGFNEFLSEGATAFLIGLVVFMVAFIIVFYVITKAYGKISDQYKFYKYIIESGQYNESLPTPFVHLVIVGGICAVLGLSSVYLSWSSIVLTANGAYLILNGVLFKLIATRVSGQTEAIKAAEQKREAVIAAAQEYMEEQKRDAVITEAMEHIQSTKERATVNAQLDNQE